MRLAELSYTSGVPAPTIKYYLREGLLSPGTRTSTTQAQYDQGHLHRLQLIRALLDVGGLSLAVIRDILTTLESNDTDLQHFLKAAQEPAPRPTVTCDADSHAMSEVLALVQRQGWLVSPRNPAVAAAAEVLATLHQLDQHDFAERLDDYARAADVAAASDVDALDRCIDTADMTETLIVGNVLGDSLLTALRRLAQTHRLRSRALLERETEPALTG